jgi:hypothetical protein
VIAAALLGILVTAGEPVRAQTPPPAPSPSPSPSPQGLSFRGSFRAYDFTRQNASKGIGGAGQVNQQSIELGLALHADYTFAKWFSVGGTYELAQPTNGCGDPSAHLSPPCGRVKAPALNPDDTLPGFDLRTLYEAYVQYKDPHLMVKAGNQVFNTPWTSPSDTRIKPTAFQGVDVNYTLSPVWSVGASDMIRFEGRVNSTFERNTLLTSFPAGTPGVPPDIFVRAARASRPPASRTSASHTRERRVSSRLSTCTGSTTSRTWRGSNRATRSSISGRSRTSPFTRGTSGAAAPR